MMKAAQTASRQPSHSAEASSLWRPTRTGFRTEGKQPPIQSTHGNQRLQQILNHGVLQAKLAINQPGDAFEQEADRVADRVMRMPDSHAAVDSNQAHVTQAEASVTASAVSPPQDSAAFLQRACSCGGTCDDCKNKVDVVQRASASSVGGEATAPPIVPDVLQSSGQPLDHATRKFMEPRFGRDFSQVRIHTDAKAAESASAVNALAFTTGNDIVFGAGQYRPRNAAGQRLVAHELTHVIQQMSASETTSPLVQRFGDPKQRPASVTCPMPNSSTATPVLTSVLFPKSGTALTAAAIAELSAVRAEWNAVPFRTARVRIDGFASTDGPQSINWTLSCDRAKAVARELETPLGGGAGIPAGFLDIFAEGATSEFSPDPEPNRRVEIRASLPIPTIPAVGCANPGDARDLDLQPVFLRTGAADPAPTGNSWSRRFNQANSIWGKLGVRFHELGAVTVDTPLKTASAHTDPEWFAIAALHSGPGIEVFLVDNDMAGPPRGGAGTLPGCGAPGKIVMSDRGTSDTLLAHELGHTMGIRHPGDAVNPGDPNTVMEPTGSNSSPNPTRNTMVNFAKILCPPGTATTCLHPDP